MTSETRFLGGREVRIWSYLIFMVLAVLVAVAVNCPLNDPETARRGVRAFLLKGCLGRPVSECGRVVHELPTGASRLDTPAVGVHGVWVNGVRTVDARGVVGDCDRPGRVLREFQS